MRETRPPKKNSIYIPLPKTHPRYPPPLHLPNSTPFSFSLENGQTNKNKTTTTTTTKKKYMKQTNIHTHIHKQETYKNTKSEIIEYKQKTSNKKKVLKQSYWDKKNLQKYHWNNFVLAIYCWTWGLHLIVVNIPLIKWEVQEWVWFKSMTSLHEK